MIDPNNINASTFIDSGFPLTANFILEHLTSGAMMPSSGTIMPLLPTNVFQKRYGNTPLWGIVKNLAASGLTVLEPLLQELGGSLVIQQAYSLTSVASEVRHMFGSGFDITVAGFENDLAYIAGDVQKIANMASSMSLNFGQSSWIHLDLNPAKLAANWSSTAVELPSIVTNDLMNGISQSGIFAMRGAGIQAIDPTNLTLDFSSIVSGIEQEVQKVVQDAINGIIQSIL